MSEIRQKYDQLYSKNEAVFGEGEPDLIVKDILKYIQNGSVLEIGAGEGRNSLFLATHGFIVEAIDTSDVAIKKIKKAAEEKGVEINAHIEDVAEWEPDKSFDIVATTFVLQHLNRQKALSVIQLLKDKTNQNGLHVIAVFTQNTDFFRNHPSEDSFYPTSEELKNLYTDWEILEYNKKKCLAFKKKDDGTPIQMMCTRIIARKP